MMAYLGKSTNEYGVVVSLHSCMAGCGDFTVCPAVAEDTQDWDFCMGRNCPGYDPARDADKMFAEEPWRIREAKGNA